MQAHTEALEIQEVMYKLDQANSIGKQCAKMCQVKYGNCMCQAMLNTEDSTIHFSNKVLQEPPVLT